MILGCPCHRLSACLRFRMCLYAFRTAPPRASTSRAILSSTSSNGNCVGFCARCAWRRSCSLDKSASSAAFAFAFAPPVFKLCLAARMSEEMASTTALLAARCRRRAPEKALRQYPEKAVHHRTNKALRLCFRRPLMMDQLLDHHHQMDQGYCQFCSAPQMEQGDCQRSDRRRHRRACRRRRTPDGSGDFEPTVAREP